MLSQASLTYYLRHDCEQALNPICNNLSKDMSLSLLRLASPVTGENYVENKEQG